jgi:hypothetical protein
MRWVQSDHSIFDVPSRLRILIAMNNDRERVISITLTEAEWQAFIARQPQPVNWLRDRIRDEVGAGRAETKSAA